MPLESGSSQATISKNIATERRAHPDMDPKQAAAIAYSTAGKGRKDADRQYWAAAGNKKAGPHASVEAATKELFEKYPNVKEATTGYGTFGPHFDIRWEKNPNIGKARKDAEDKKPAQSQDRPGYNATAVQKEINKDKRIGGKEAKAIHALLKGRKDAEDHVRSKSERAELAKLIKGKTREEAVKFLRSKGLAPVELYTIVDETFGRKDASPAARLDAAAESLAELAKDGRRLTERMDAVEEGVSRKDDNKSEAGRKDAIDTRSPEYKVFVAEVERERSKYEAEIRELKEKERQIRKEQKDAQDRFIKIGQGLRQKHKIDG